MTAVFHAISCTFRQVTGFQRALASNIDGLLGSSLQGWAFAPRRARQRLTILAETRPNQFADYLADLFRADVHRARIGSDGYCGFAIPASHFEWPGPWRIVVSPKHMSLRGSPFVPDASDTAPRPFHLKDGLLLDFDPIGRSISGWASSKSDPASRRRLRLETAGRALARQTACLHRRVIPAGASDPFHGFSFMMPTSVKPIKLIDEDMDVVLYEWR